MKQNQVIKTTTLSALVAVSKSENDMDYVQVIPDNPRVGLVQPFSGWGKGQLLNNGSFDFIRKKRMRGKPELQAGYVSLSFCADGFDRVTFTVPSELRAKLPTILRKDSLKVINHLIKKGFSR
jgi:hypothetical protein